VDDYIPGTVVIFLNKGWIRISGIPKAKEEEEKMSTGENKE
jgi:hypothetical protein